MVVALQCVCTKYCWIVHIKNVCLCGVLLTIVLSLCLFSGFYQPFSTSRMCFVSLIGKLLLSSLGIINYALMCEDSAAGEDRLCLRPHAVSVCCSFLLMWAYLFLDKRQIYNVLEPLFKCYLKKKKRRRQGSCYVNLAILVPCCPGCPQTWYALSTKSWGLIIHMFYQAWPLLNCCFDPGNSVRSGWKQ